MIYDPVSTHPLLSGKAKALTPDVLSAQQDLAETLLALPEPAVTGALTLSRLALAITLQINFQVEQGIDPLIEALSQSTHSKQLVRYWDRIINPQAQKIVDSLALTGDIGDGYETLTSLRTRG